VYLLPLVFPDCKAERENRAIGVTGHLQIPFSALAVDCLPCLDFGGRPTQFFPFYIYDEDGSNRRENITDWALNEYRTHYHDQKITKWDIFHYVYALLHHPDYRERYAANLKRELPRIPYAPDLWGFAKAGKQLADLHVNYEEQPEYLLERIENPNEKISYRVEKMRLGKDKTALIYNSFLTLSGIPSEVYEYRLGNRSALEWVIDQYQVSTDKRSGITNDPNREDDEQYIVRLIGQVVHVSLETVKIVKALPSLGIEDAARAHSAQ
jgi:predicted helicase